LTDSYQGRILQAAESYFGDVLYQGMASQVAEKVSVRSFVSGHGYSRAAKR